MSLYLMIDSIEQLEAAIDKKRDLIFDGNLCVTINIHNVRHISARDIIASDISASGSISASGNISASDIRASGNISASGSISASGNISASDIRASDISASDIRASGNISASGSIKCHTIKTASVYAVAVGDTLTCHGIYPASGPADRQQWADRFGIYTSTGCYDEWHQRLSKVAKKLLRKKCWLPIERQMLLSVTGFYENGGAA